MRGAIILGASLALCAAAPVEASSRIQVASADLLDWAVHDGRVYFRNLNTLDPAWLGCCWNYYLDISTDTGRAQLAAFLTFKGSGKSFELYKEDPSTAGQIDLIGNFS